MIKLSIIHNTDKEDAIKIYKELLKYLKAKKEFEVLDDKNISQAEYIVVIGGDGTLLRGFKKIKDKKVKIIAINSGTLGYLTEIRKDGYKKIFENILKGKVNIEERYFFTVKIGKKKYNALNEVFLTKDNIKRNIVSSEIYVDDKFLGKFKGDGVIIATPTGSTAYSLSAGGPIVTPELKLFLITPIAPHNLNTRPIILSGDVKIVLTLVGPSEFGIVNVDGHTHNKINIEDKVEISYSKESLKIVLPDDRNYYNVLREKLKWGENLC